jgi:transposase InsO family protein
MFDLALALLTALLGTLKSRRDLVLENLALRHQLVVLSSSDKRPRFSSADRLVWTCLRRLWDGWKGALFLVQPATVVRWHREGFRRYWGRKSLRRPGRPRVDPELRSLIRKMATANPLWGAPRVHGELLKLGLEISESTVSRWMPKSRKTPSPSWRAFLENHLGDLVSIDFFTVPTARFRVLFCLLVLSHKRRRVLHFNVTDHPTAQWTAHQIVEAFPWETGPRYLLRDRDAVFGLAFRHRVAGLGITEVLTAPRSPWQNPYVERLIGSIRRECLDHLVVLNARHLHRILGKYFDYYHRSRTHLSLYKDSPRPRPVQLPTDGEIVELPEVGGLHHRYERRAA